MNHEILTSAFGLPESTAKIWAKPLSDAMYKFQIETEQQQAQFLAQCCHESQHFKRVTENLNYSAPGLLLTWPNRFNQSNVNQYVGSPVKIANKAYGGRMGNGAEETGDGWKYRGRGLIMVTGKENYAACGLALKIDLINNPDLLATTTYAALSAGWFWQSKKLNVIADNTEAVTRRINGGLIGLAERKALYLKCLAVIQA